MAKTTPPPGNTGAGALAGAGAAAANLAGPALDLAQGATAVQAASNALQGAVLDKLLGPTALFAGGLIGVLRTVKSIVEQSGILERGMKNIASVQQIEGKFETLLKSAEKAQTRIKELYKFTASSPFDFKDVAEANRTLEALTKGALSGADGMKMVGDVSAGTGQSMSETAEKVGKLYAALRSGRSLDKIMFQMQMSGAVTDELAAKLETLTQSGAGFNEMWAAVSTSLSRSDGGMKNEMKNLDALAKRLKLAGELMEMAFAEPFKDAQARSIEVSIKATENVTPVLARIGADLQPVLQFMSGAKNSVAEATIATKGFAEMLGAAWDGAKTLFAGLAGTTIAVFATRLLTSTVSVMRFGSQLKAAAEIAKAAPSSIEGFAKATSLAADASAAFARNEYLSAAALKLKSYWSVVATTATNIHATSMLRAKTATEGVSIATYLWATATQVATGGLKLLGVGLRFVGTAMASFIVANPILAVGTAVLAAVYAMKQWADSISATDQAYSKMIGTLGKVRAEMRAQVEAVRNLDQWKAALADNDTALKKNAEAQQAMGARPEGNAGFYTAMGKQIPIATGAQKDYDNLYEEHNRTTRDLVASRAKLMTRDMDTVGLGSDEQAKLGDRVAGTQRLAEAGRQAGVANADDVGRLRFMESEIVRLTREADVGEAIDLKRTSPLRNPGATELTKLQDQIGAIEGGTRQAAPGELNELYKKRTELGSFADTHVDKRASAIALTAERNILKSMIELKNLELELELEIASVRMKGGETSAMEATKELLILKKQLEIAKLKGANGKQEAADKAVAIAKIEGDRTKARTEIALDRAKDNAQIDRNPRAAQALQDVTDREKLRAEYGAKGLTAGQADSDFAANIKAQAAQTAPRIVADSLQSIGGGGGSAGSDPMLAAQVRIEKINATQVAYLKIIADAASGGSSTLRD